jgi:hypothetical protein
MNYFIHQFTTKPFLVRFYPLLKTEDYSAQSSVFSYANISTKK